MDICKQPGEECGKWCVDCSHQDPCVLKPGQVPYCPGNGATGDGCIRMLESIDEECGDGFRCTHDDHHFYGCAPINNMTNMVCCSQGQGCEEPGQECGKWCVNCTPPDCDLKPGQLPYCPANGATGSGCVRMEPVVLEDWEDISPFLFLDFHNCNSPNNHIPHTLSIYIMQLNKQSDTNIFFIFVSYFYSTIKSGSTRNNIL